MRGMDICQTVPILLTTVTFTGLHFFRYRLAYCYHVTECFVYVVYRGRHKPLIGRHDTESTTGQTQQLLIMLSTMDVTWFLWHIVSVDQTNGWARISGECHSHEQKLC